METNQYTRITVALSKQEWEALQNVSQQEYRHPREQARYLLRGVLFGDSGVLIPVSNSNTNIPECELQHGR